MVSSGVFITKADPCTGRMIPEPRSGKANQGTFALVAIQMNQQGSTGPRRTRPAGSQSH
jgi:hypothetical protein